MAHYVLSDIHGEADRFYEMLKIIHFSEQDTLYILGDAIDRGPDGVELLQYIMRSPNVTMLLGNHEYMCLRYFAKDATELDVRRWAKNGNEPTLRGFSGLSEQVRQDILRFLRGLPTHLQVNVAGQDFYLVHGFPGGNVHDEVWGRPTPDAANPIEGCRLIIGHTTVLSLLNPKEQRAAAADRLRQRGEHLRIYHGPGFIDIDCGCGHNAACKALACLRLEDMKEFYV